MMPSSRLGVQALSIAGALALVGCASAPLDDAPTGPLATHYLTVSRYASTPMDETRADEIMAQMNDVIRTRDGIDDVACNILFVRDGEVTVFTEGTGSINGPGDFQLLESLPGRIKVVSQINWCGGFAPNIIGCAPLYGDSMTVVRHSASLEGILWLHEFGHLEGLHHRNDANAVMNATIGVNRRRVTDWEGEGFRYGAVITQPTPESP